MLADSFLGCGLGSCSDSFQRLELLLFLVEVVAVQLATVNQELMARETFEFLPPCLLTEADHDFLFFCGALHILHNGTFDLNLANVKVKLHWTVVFLCLCIL